MNHIIFDLDGTLIDSAPDIHAATNLLLSEHQLGALSLSQTRSFIGNGSKKLVARAFGAFENINIPDEELNQLTNRFVEIYMNDLVTETVLYPNVRNTLKKLTNLGFELSLCTNKPIQPTNAILDKLKLADFFQSVVGGDSYDEKKPSPLPLQKIMEAQNVQSENVIMVGDSIHDVEAARDADVKSILVSYGYSRIPHSEIPATVLIHTFDDLPRVIREI